MKKYYYLLGFFSLLLLPLHSLSQYCTPTFSTGCSFGDNIDGVVLGAINNTTPGCSPSSYGDFTAMSASVNQSLSYTVNVTLNASYGEYIGVFIDWNQNQSFGDVGEFYSTGAISAAGSTTPISISVPVTATLGATRMRVIIDYDNLVTSTGSCGGWNYGEAEDYTINVGAAPACQPAGGLTATAVTATSATLNWSMVVGAVDYVVEWGPSGFTPGTGAQSGMASAVTGTSTPATGLTPQTTYQFYVQTNCGSGSTSPWAGPVSFTTPCAAFVAPFYENLTTTTTPACWSQSASSGGPWEFPGFPGYTASGVLDHTNGSSGNYATLDHSGADAGVILKSPLIDVSALLVPELRFWIWSHYNGSGLTTYNLTYVEAYNGTTWDQIAVIQGDFGPQWTEFNYVIPAANIFNGNLVQIRFRGESGGDGSDFYNDILLDDISVIEAPTCPAPSALTIIASDTSSAQVGWTVVGSETQWVLEYGPVGFTPGTGTFQVTSDNPDTLTGLTSGQFYDVYVRAICGPGDTSFYVGAESFNTYGQGMYMEADNACGPNFIDITNTGINLNLTDDSEAGLPLPFPWLFQGTLVNNITIGNNGGIIVGSMTANVGYSMSDQGFFPFVQDLDNDINGVDQVGVLWQVLGTAPNRQFVVLWKDRTHYSGFTNVNPCTFEFIYDEATNEAYYVYPDVDFANPAYDFGADAEIGVRGPGNNIDVSINSATYLQNNDCVHLYYTNCPKPSNLALQYVTPDEAAFSWNPGLSNETNWTIIYGPAGFDPATGGTTLTSTNPSVTLVGLEQLTDYCIYVYSECASGDQSFAITTCFRTAPLCSDPSGVSANTAIDSLMSDWTWTSFDPMYPATGFDIVYGGLGFDPATGGTTNNGDAMIGDTIVNGNFLAGGVYEMYLRAVCDTLVSNLVGPITFKMPLSNDDVCMAQALSVDNTAKFFNNQGATIEANEQSIAPPITGAQTTDGWLNNTLSFTTWFKFNAPSSGNMRISGAEGDFNGQIAVYEVSNCGDFTSYTLIAANDDAIDGTTLAPNFTICGLTAGAEYYMMHDSYSSSQTGTYSLRLSEINLQAGSSNGITNVCSKDTISLFSGISGYDANGIWNDIDGTFHIVNDTAFSTNGLAYQVYNFEYRLEDGCAFDSIVTQFEVYAPSSAGNDGTLTICKNQAVGLFSGLSGTVNTGGMWYSPNGVAKAGSNVEVGELSVAGNYNFKYIVGNGVCPDDTSIVNVTVQPNCDFLNVGELVKEGIEVFPNPTNGTVFITSTQADIDYSIEVTDVNGRTISQTSKVNLASKAHTVDLSSFENGVYFINLQTVDGKATYRMVKQ